MTTNFVHDGSDVVMDVDSGSFFPLTTYQNDPGFDNKLKTDHYSKMLQGMHWNIIMRKETANEIYSLALDAITSLTSIIRALPEDTAADEMLIIKRGVGTAIGDIQMDLLQIINAQYPELDDLKE